MITDYLNEKTIALQQTAADRYDAIHIAGKLLADAGLVSENYIRQMKEALDTLGPYMVISPGIAFAHAQPSDAVHEDCISMITLKEPVVFGNEKNDPVRVVFALAGKTNKNHISVMRDVSLLITKEDFMEKVLQETDIQKLLKYFKYFQVY